MDLFNPNTSPFILNINKPVGLTSFDVIRKLKRHLPLRKMKIGHLGSLDPFADGVLLVGINGATRVQEYIKNIDQKEYLAKGVFGKLTETLDTEGEVVKEEEVGPFLKDPKDLESKYQGDYLQSIPMFSAVKFEGKPLYEYARKGIKVHKDPVKRQIFDLKIHKCDQLSMTFSTSVSSGTYIRQLFLDMATDLGTIGYLEKLTRLKVGSCLIKDAIALEEMTSWEAICEHAISPDSCFGIGQVELSQEDIQRLKNGLNVTSDIGHKLQHYFWLKGPNGLEGIGQVENASIRPVVNWNV